MSLDISYLLKLSYIKKLRLTERVISTKLHQFTTTTTITTKTVLLAN